MVRAFPVRQTFPDMFLRGRGRLRGVLLPAVLLLALSSCRCQEQLPPDYLVALVNGERINLSEYQARLAEETALVKSAPPLNAGEMASLKEEVLDRLIEQKIMVQRAGMLSLTVGEAELASRIEEIKRDYNGEQFDRLFGAGGISYAGWKEALRKRALLEKLIAVEVNEKISVTDDEAERHYRANRKAYMTEKWVRVAQIVVRDRDRAEAILKRLKMGEDFGKVAREVSIGPEAAKGGDLDFFARGVMPEAIDRVVFTLPVGKVSGIVQSPYGYHIFKLLGRKEAGGRIFSEVKERVIADLRKLKEAEAYERWIEGLKAKAVIRIDRPLPEWTPPVETGTKKAPAQAEAEND
ncbi:MAG: peptidylprolyl isomerase [Proteobacteria bacterium]|nr:peptidylprolyl isomerase [Pseudomonadota bacterium]